MKGRYFLDTNVLVYALLDEDEKSEQALQLLDGATISVQVLNELANVARKKAKLDWPDIQALTGAVAELTTIEPLTAETHTAGLEIAERYGLSLYDSMIVAAAIGARCMTLYTEDMQHGQLLEPIRVVNPFR
jgi:predicted nucleic acid-binding protein